MFIHSVELENIRSYIKENIEFGEGSTLLSGDVGSGKSSILLAIEFALFGVLKGMLNGKVLLRHGAVAGSVTLKFSLDGDNFIIKRTLKRNKEGKVIAGIPQFLQNNEEIEHTTEELRSKVLKILGYPQELVRKSKGLLYRYTVYTPQEEMQKILGDEQMRIEVIRKIFELDKYKRIQENAMAAIRALREKQRVLKEKIKLLSPAAERVNELKREFARLPRSADTKRAGSAGSACSI